MLRVNVAKQLGEFSLEAAFESQHITQLLAARADLASPSSQIKVDQAPEKDDTNCKNPLIHQSTNLPIPRRRPGAEAERQSLR